MANLAFELFEATILDSRDQARQCFNSFRAEKLQCDVCVIAVMFGSYSGIEKNSLNFLIEYFLKYRAQCKLRQSINLRTADTLLDDDATPVKIQPIREAPGTGITRQQQLLLLTRMTHKVIVAPLYF